MSIRKYIKRLKPAGILYVDVYPYHIDKNGKIEFLAFKRIDGIELSNTWQPVCGKILKKEKISHAFFRQVKNKTGIEPEKIFRIDFVSMFYDDYYDTVMFVPTAAAEITSKNIRIDETLHNEYKWISCEEVGNYFIWPNQLECVKLINNILTKNVSLEQRLLKNK